MIMMGIMVMMMMRRRMMRIEMLVDEIKNENDRVTISL
jgi:hypothetical protein